MMTAATLLKRFPLRISDSTIAAAGAGGI